MDSLLQLKRKALKFDVLILILGLIVLFLFGYRELWYSFSLGVALGMMNLHLHTWSLESIVPAKANEGEASKVALKASAGYVLRFGLIAGVLAFVHLIRGLELFPALIGLAATYAALIVAGIMNARVGKKDGR